MNPRTVFLGALTLWASVVSCYGQSAVPIQTRLSGAACDIKPGLPSAGVAQFGTQSAFYIAPSRAYGHGVLGDRIEAGAFLIQRPWDPGTCDRVKAPEQSVFEDLTPRLADLNGDGLAEVITINSDFSKGARIAVYGYPDAHADHISLLAVTPHIGTRNRWLAPVGIADFNGDGRMDIAYVDRPHLAKTLRIWSFEDQGLREIAILNGLTNHRIGQDFISGGVRDCGTGPEMVTADANWQTVVATRFEGAQLVRKSLGLFRGAASFKQALACDPVK